MTSITKTNESNQNLNQKQDYLIDDQNFFLEIGRNVIQHLLDTEMTEFLAAEPYERNMTRQGYRSGSRPRTLKTRGSVNCISRSPASVLDDLRLNSLLIINVVSRHSC